VIWLAVGIYFVIGTLLARALFVNVLGDADRYIKRIPTYDDKSTWEYSAEYSRALTYAGWSLVLPWLTLAIWFFQMETPHEKTARRKKELEELDEQVKRLEKDYGFKFTGELQQ
jgi:hypothetical protein